MGSAIDTIIRAVAQFFASGFLAGVESSELWLFSQLDRLILRSTGSPLTSAWFYHFFQKMELLALAFVLPLFLIAVVSSIFLGSGGYLFRLVGVYLPISLAGSGVFFFIYRALAASIDSMSSWLAGSEHLSLESLGSFASALNVGGGGNPVPFLVVALAGIISLLGALSLYFELLLRQGVMMVLGAFIPFAVLFMLLSSSRSVMYRYIEVALGVLLSKLVVVVLLCLGGELLVNSTAAASFREFIMGTAMVVLASFSPFLLFALIPIAHLDHQSQLSSSIRRSARGVAGKGGMLIGGGTSSQAKEIPLASSTAVPSYLKREQ